MVHIMTRMTHMMTRMTRMTRWLALCQDPEKRWMSAILLFEILNEILDMKTEFLLYLQILMPAR